LVNLPSPPQVALRIIELGKDPEIDMGKIAKALSLDSALATKILRMANSPLYVQRRKSENLRQALLILGLNATMTLALSFSLVKNLRTAKPNGIDHPLYWRRALLAATSARALADAMHHPLAEEIFLAALLQDVGILALDQAVPDLYQLSAAAQRDHAALAELERARLKTDHAEVGGWLLRLWNLPDRLLLAISRSHRLDPTPTTDTNVVFERCVALSGPVAELFLQSAAEHQFAATALQIERSLGLDKMAFGQVLATVGAMIPETEALFEIDALASEHPDLIIERARDVLLLRSLNALRELSDVRDIAGSNGSRTLELEEETRRDPLTGVYKRAYFDHILQREFDKAAAHPGSLSLLVADLDNLAAINDCFGQPAGDRILQATARLLRTQCRDADCIARLGGQDFAVLMPTTDAATARGICDQIVSAFEDAEHLVGSENARVTISIGCASLGSGTKFATAGEFLKAAIRALQQAKAQGRSRTAQLATVG
jgi:diguanylate cyclase (GGDEF)-like protein